MVSSDDDCNDFGAIYPLENFSFFLLNMIKGCSEFIRLFFCIDFEINHILVINLNRSESLFKYKKNLWKGKLHFFKIFLSSNEMKY